MDITPVHGSQAHGLSVQLPIKLGDQLIEA
jgi:hypothetical protein